MTVFQGMSPEVWSAILLYGGIGLMISAAVLGIVSLIVLRIVKKRLTAHLEEEFGKKRR